MLNLASNLRSRVEAALENRIPRALTPPQRSAPELMPTSIASVDALTGGVPLGCLTEICGTASSGRTSVLMAMIAECMRRGEICALVDASDAFDPQSAANAGVDLSRLLWVRCGSGDRVIGSSGEVKRSAQHSLSIQPAKIGKVSRQSAIGSQPVNGFVSHQNPGKFSAKSRPPIADSPPTSPDRPITRWPDLEQALKATDLLLQAGGFGLVVLDLADIPESAARRVPLTTWFRFRRTVENTSTALVVVEEQPHAKSCASLVMEFVAQAANWTEAADRQATPVGTHLGGITQSSANSLDGVAFRVTSEGIAIPFDRPASSFELPQRWNIPRLLNAVHVHLQVTRSRMNRAKKFPAQSEHAFIFGQDLRENTKDTKDTKVVPFLN